MIRRGDYLSWHQSCKISPPNPKMSLKMTFGTLVTTISIPMRQKNQASQNSSQPIRHPLKDTPAAPLEEILSDLDDDPLPPALPPQETEPADPPETTTTPRRYRAKKTGQEATPTTSIEKIFIGTLLAVLVGLALWGIYTYSKAAPNGNLADTRKTFHPGRIHHH